MATGVVAAWNDEKGYGFVEPDGGGGRRVFVHRTSIREVPGRRRALTVGERVDYKVEQSERGPCASNVTVWTGDR